MVGLSSREFSVENIQVQNVPEGMDVDVITQKLTVIVRGPSALMLNLTEEDITAVVDFTNAEVGSSTFKVTIIFPEQYRKLGAVGTYSVSATVTAKES